MLYYIHGYLSNPNSLKGVILKEKMGVKPIKYRDCKPEDIVISDCLKNISKEIKNDKNVVLIGSSLGGLLAANIALENPYVKKLILLNPAVIPPTEKNLDSEMSSMRIFKEMKNNKLFERKIPADVYILVGTEDDLIPFSWIHKFADFQEATIKFLHDDHSFSKNISNLPDIISRFI